MPGIMNSQILIYYLHRFLFGGYFAVPIMVLNWQDKGLSLTQVMLLQTIFALNMAVFELPTGYIADRFGRKRTLLLGSLFLTLASGCYFFVQSFWGFVLAETSFAFGLALFSGSEAALLYEQLCEQKRESEYQKIYGRGTFLHLIGLGLSNVAGGYLGAMELVYPYYAMTGCFGLMFLVICFVHEPERVQEVYQSPYRDAKTVFENYLKVDSTLRWLFSFSAFYFVGTQIAFWMYQPLFQVNEVPFLWYGWIFASFQFFAALVAGSAHILEKHLSLRASYILIGSLIPLSYFFMGWLSTPFIFCFAYLQQTVRAVSKVLVSDGINRRVDSKFRASILSIQGLFNFFAQGLTILIAGMIADKYGIQSAFQVYFGCLILAWILLSLKKPEKKL